MNTIFLTIIIASHKWYVLRGHFTLLIQTKYPSFYDVIVMKEAITAMVGIDMTKIKPV